MQTNPHPAYIEDGIALEYAGFWRRLAAMLVDVFALTVICGVVILTIAPYQWFGLGNLVGSGNVFNEPPWRMVPYLIAGNVFSLAVNVAYFVGFWVWRGQTPGKMLLGIKIVRPDNARITVSQGLLRYLGYIVSGAVILIGFIWVAFDPMKQGFHDKIAETFVVRIPEVPVTEAAPRPSLGG
jgi:uncharacterized RDD family membrane protein YckC